MGREAGLLSLFTGRVPDAYSAAPQPCFQEIFLLCQREQARGKPRRYSAFASALSGIEVSES